MCISLNERNMLIFAGIALIYTCMIRSQRNSKLCQREWRRDFNRCILQKHKYDIFTPQRHRRGLFFTAVCLCARLPGCVCVCPDVSLWTKFQPNGCSDFDAGFAKRLLTALSRTLSKLVTLGKKGKVTVTQYPFFLHNSMLTSKL